MNHFATEKSSSRKEQQKQRWERYGTNETEKNRSGKIEV